MKSVLTLVSLTLLAFSANAEVGYRPGSVVEQACGQNSMTPMSNSTRYDFVSKVCKVNVAGLNVKAPLYTFEVVSNRGIRTTYVYSQQSLKPVYTTMPVTPGKPYLPTGRLLLAELKIIGTAVKGQFSQMYFVRDPGTVSLVIGFDRQNLVESITGNLRMIGDSSNTLPIRVDKFELVYHTM